MELHITNGDAVGEMLLESPSVEGKVLCWRDVLHDGPLQDLAFSQYAKQRASFLYQQVSQADPRNSISRQSIENDFKQRQQILDSVEQFDQITLWFEHDLYDQLQILEVLKSLSPIPELPPLYLICIDRHPEVNYFYGLGNLNTKQLIDLYPKRQQLSGVQLEQANQIWQALTASTPLHWSSYLDTGSEHFPYLGSALERFAQEFPAAEHGLTRTQWQLMRCLQDPLQALPAHLDRLQNWQQAGMLEGESAEQRYQRLLKNTGSFSRLFLSLQELEEAPFMGDLWVKVELDRLCSGEHPLLESLPLDTPTSGPWAMQYQMTQRGIDLMQGQGHWLDHNSYDLWRGGVHIRDDNLWYWDQQQQKFIFHSNL